MQNPPQPRSTNSQKSKPKSRISKRQRNRRRNKQKSLNCNQNKGHSHPHPTVNQPARRNGVDIWRDAYENAVRWHSEHQSNYWRRAAENLQRENQMLKQQLQRVANSNIANVYYETSDDDEDEEKKKLISVKKEEQDGEDNQIDVEYLEFLQITFKHREELRMKRQAEAEMAQEVVESSAKVEAPTLG